MKPILFAAALMLGGAALAQTTDDTTADADTATEADTTAADTQATTTTSTTTSTTATTSTMSQGTGMTVAPGNTAPERDARGIAVVSEAAVAPPGYNEPARTVPAGTAMPTATPPATSSAGPLPPCSRTVTDRCTQTYERGRSPG
jgi:hypothetical protein